MAQRYYDNVVTLRYLRPRVALWSIAVLTFIMCISSLKTDAQQFATVGGWHSLPKDLPCWAKYTLGSGDKQHWGFSTLRQVDKH